jgi:hypothetical protein
MDAAISNIASVTAVVSILAMIILIYVIHCKIKAKTWLWMLGALGFSFGVRFFIMLVDLFPSHFGNHYTLLNGLMAIAWTLLSIGFLGLYLAIRSIGRK